MSNGKLHHSSWVGFFCSFGSQESLNLHEVHFLNSLTDQGNENWNIVERTLTACADTPPVREDLSFKQRVERYVVDGGEFPLPWPIESKDESHWENVLRDFDLNLIGLGSTAKTRSVFGWPIIVGGISEAKVFSHQLSNCRTRNSRTCCLASRLRVLIHFRTQSSITPKESISSLIVLHVRQDR